MKTFKEAVYARVKKIPKGSVMTYKQVAEAIGYPTAARAVGTVLRMNKDASVPCHRVIRTGGDLGGYNGFRGKKEKLLREEGYLK